MAEKAKRPALAEYTALEFAIYDARNDLSFDRHAAAAEIERSGRHLTQAAVAAVQRVQRDLAWVAALESIRDKAEE